MDAVVFGVVLVGLAAWTAAPLYRSSRPAPDDDRSLLEARRNALFEELRELELDRASGLLDTEEYERRRVSAEAEAADLLRRLGEGIG